MEFSSPGTPKLGPQHLSLAAFPNPAGSCSACGDNSQRRCFRTYSKTTTAFDGSTCSHPKHLKHMTKHDGSARPRRSRFDFFKPVGWFHMGPVVDGKLLGGHGLFAAECDGGREYRSLRGREGRHFTWFCLFQKRTFFSRWW